MKELERCMGWDDASWYWTTESELDRDEALDDLDEAPEYVEGLGILIPSIRRCLYVATPGDAFCPRHRFLCDNTPLDTRTDDQKAEDAFIRGEAHL